MTKKIVLTTVALAMASLTVQAVTYTTAASPTGTGNWANTATWGGGGSPGATAAGDIARITGGNTVTLDSTIPNTLGNIQIGRGTAGNLIVNSGANITVSLGNNTEVGNTAVGTYTQNGGTFNEQSAFNISGQATTTAGSSAIIYGGNLNIGTVLAVGKFATGSFTIMGGTVVANSMAVGAVGINSSASLQGGSLTLNATFNPLLFNSVGSTLTIANAATLTLGGDQNTAIASFAFGNLLWNTGTSTLGGLYGTGDQTFDNGVGSYLHSYFDSANSKTYVWVDTTPAPVPEPTTLTLALLGGLGLLVGLRRKRF